MGFGFFRVRGAMVSRIDWQVELKVVVSSSGSEDGASPAVVWAAENAAENLVAVWAMK